MGGEKNVENQPLNLDNQIEEKFIIGEVAAVYFSNPSNFYKVMLVFIQETNTTYEEKKIVVTGNFGQIQEGDTYQFYGKLTDHPRYGLQFNADRYAKEQPSTASAVIAYLSSKRFKGIGEKTAEKIVDTLGEDCLDTLLDQPDRLSQVPGLNKEKRKMIIDVLKEEQGMQRIILTLNKYGIGNQLAYKIYARYEEQTLEVIQKNPYQLVADIEGIGFNRADSIADELGIEADASERIQAGILYTLSELSLSNGDTYVDAEPLLKRTLNLLEESRPFIIEPDQIVENMVKMVEQQVIVEDEKRFYLRSLYASEWGIVNAIERLSDVPEEQRMDKEEINEQILRLEKQLNISYGESQKEAIEHALISPIFLLTGGPGTGKTTVLNGIVTLFAEMNDLSLDPHAYKGESFPILLAAPTGRAAKRMKETTGLPASTIHRLLGLTADEDEQNAEEVDRNLKGEILVIDEMSMVDTWLAYQLLKAVPQGMKVIMVGDKDQLPSVGPGQVLRDFIESGKIPMKELTDIYRQGDDSSIIPLAHEIKQDRLPTDFTQPKKDRNFFHCTTSKVMDVITQVVNKAIERGYTAEQVQVLAPMYKGPAGIDQLNKQLQELFNPNDTGRKKEVKHIENVYRIGDKVLQLVNDPERNVFNGDMGKITGIIPKAESDTKSDELVIDFDGNEVQYLRAEWNKITLAYCCSIHKAQGSEYDMVILPLVSSFRRMLKKDLVYTAITRASKFLILCGEEAAYQQSVHSTTMLRKTTLKERLISDDEAPTVDIEQAFEEENETKEVEKERETSKEMQDETLQLPEEAILTPSLVETNSIDPMVGMSGITPYDNS